MYTVIIYILCYVDIIGSGDLFQSRLKCKSARAIFLFFTCSYKRQKLQKNFSCAVEKNK